MWKVVVTMRDDVTMKNTHPLQESVTASQASQVNAETNGNADTEVEKQTISFSANLLIFE